MKKIRHRFLDYQINPLTETLIIGTFNPDTFDNQADFFYGRNRNYLWRLLSSAYDEEDLKYASKEEKLLFISKYKIDFIDLIAEVLVDEGQEANFNDDYIDQKVFTWRNVILELEKLKKLKRICFTRKTFTNIPNIRNQVEVIEKHCDGRDILFKAIVTPARFYREDKQTAWNDFLLGLK